MGSSRAPAYSQFRAAAGIAAAAVMLASIPAHTQDRGSFIHLIEPQVDACQLVLGAAPRARPVCVMGVAFDPTGTVRVLVDGVDARLEAADSAGAYPFTGVTSSAAGQLTVELTLIARDGRRRVEHRRVRVRPSILVANGTPFALGSPSFVVIHEPFEWAGTGSRGVTGAPRQSVRVTGVAHHGSGVRSVWVDGRRAALAPDSSGGARFLAYAAPDADREWIPVVVEGHGGPPLTQRYLLRADSTLPAGGTRPGLSSAPRGRRWALVIGVAHYADSTIAPQRFAASDARAFYDFLRSPQAGGGGFAPENVRLLLDEGATADSVLSAMDALQAAGPNDQVVIFIAGRGAEDPIRPSDAYLLTHDADFRHLPATAVSVDSLRGAIQALRVSSVLLIADIGTDAGLSPGVRGGSGARVKEALLQEILTGYGGLAVLTASRPEQQTLQDTRWGGGHGVFTYILLEALRGTADADRDGIVTLTEVIGHTTSQVRRETAGQQVPAVAETSFDPFLPLAIVPGSANLPSHPGASTAVSTGTPAAVPTELEANRTAVRMFPNSLIYRRRLGDALLRAGDNEEAAVELREAVHLDPWNPETRYQLGLAYRATGRRSEAVPVFEAAIRLDSGREEYFHALVTTLLDAEQTDAALACVRLAFGLSGAQQTEPCGSLRIMPAFAAPALATAVAEALIEGGREADAERFLTELLDGGPVGASASWHFLRGVARHALGSADDQPELWDAALADYGLALLDSTVAGAALNNSGRIAEARGRFDEALTLYRQGAMRGSAHPVFAFNLGRVFEQVGEPDSAMSAYRAALVRDPRYAPAHLALLDLALRARPDSLPQIARSSAPLGFTIEAIESLAGVVAGRSRAPVPDTVAEAALVTLVEVAAGLGSDPASLHERLGSVLQSAADHGPLSVAVHEVLTPVEAFESGRHFTAGGWWTARPERFRAYSLLLARLGDQALAAGAAEQARHYYIAAVGPARFRAHWMNFDALIPALALTAEAAPREYRELSETFASPSTQFPYDAPAEAVRRLWVVQLEISKGRGDEGQVRLYAEQMNEVTRNLALEYGRRGADDRASELLAQTVALYEELGITERLASLPDRRPREFAFALFASESMGAVLEPDVEGRLPLTSEPPSEEVALLRRRNLQVPVAGVTAAHLRDTYTDMRSGGRVHNAIDIYAPHGTPVLAADDGILLRLRTGGLGGITIYHLAPDGQTMYYYAHLQQYAANVREGMQVRKGQVIGYVGNTGNAGDIPHLHFSIGFLRNSERWWESQNVNPYDVWN